jgi:hypothetical protein
VAQWTRSADERPTTTVRSSRVSRRIACVLGLTIAIAGNGEVSAHRRDEYLQAARLAIDPDRVQIELDLTPGIALADAIIAEIDNNRDGVLSPDEQRAYVGVVLSALELDVDDRTLRMRPVTSTFPDVEAMRRGEGTIRLKSDATLPGLSLGSHQLSFRNRHHPDRGVYLANALVPEREQVAITAQRRDDDQSELTIDYVLRPGPAIPKRAWLLGSVAGAAALWALAMRRLRSASDEAG